MRDTTCGTRETQTPRREHPGRHRPQWVLGLVSPVEPGSTHDLSAARLHVLPALYLAAAAGMPTLADKRLRRRRNRDPRPIQGRQPLPRTTGRGTS